MTTIAVTLQSFFTDRLLLQRQASPHTIACYRDTIRLLLGFLQTRTGKPPSRLDWSDLDTGVQLKQDKGVVGPDFWRDRQR